MTDRHGEANSGISQFCQMGLKTVRILVVSEIADIARGKEAEGV